MSPSADNLTVWSPGDLPASILFGSEDERVACPSSSKEVAQFKCWLDIICPNTEESGKHKAKALMGKQWTEDKNNTHWKALSANDLLSSVCSKYKV